jgi:hypothetical protein
MNLAQLEKPTVTIISSRPKVDMDAITHFGPAVARHLNALSSICEYIPNSENLKNQVEDLKSLFSTYIPLQDNMLEKTDVEEQMVKHEALKAVGMLRNELVKYGRSGKPITDETVNRIMKDVLAKNDRTDINSLMQTWKSSKAGLTPLQWAKQSPDIHDTSIHDTAINSPIDETMRNLCVMEMYETLRVGLGEKAWVAISKRLKAEGYDYQLVEDVIDYAINRANS